MCNRPNLEYIIETKMHFGILVVNCVQRGTWINYSRNSKHNLHNLRDDSEVKIFPLSADFDKVIILVSTVECDTMHPYRWLVCSV